MKINYRRAVGTPTRFSTASYDLWSCQQDAGCCRVACGCPSRPFVAPLVGPRLSSSSSSSSTRTSITINSTSLLITDQHHSYFDSCLCNKQYKYKMITISKTFCIYQLTRPKVVIFLLFTTFPSGSSFLLEHTRTTIKSTHVRRLHHRSSSSLLLSSSSVPSPEIENTDENLITSSSDNDDNNIEENEDGPKKSFWMPKGKKSWWVERKNLNDLKVGDELYGHVVQEFISGRTGPKLYFDCGVGRTDKKGNWHIVTGMMRMEKSKASVAKKRAARFRSKDRVPLYVSRIQKECARLEVCLSPEEAEKYLQKKPKIPVTSLQSGQEVKGTIYKICPYGAIVDVEANRRGLLHIKKVASLYGRYIDKEKGLVEAGIERGARVRLMVESVDDKRLFLDFTPDVKEEAESELKQSEKSSANSDDESLNNVDLEDWAEYANQQTAVLEIETQTDIENDDDDEDNDDEEEDLDD